MFLQNKNNPVCLMKVRLSYIIPGFIFLSSIFLSPVFFGFQLEKSAYIQKFGYYIFPILGVCILYTLKFYLQFFIHRKCFVRIASDGLRVGWNLAIQFDKTNRKFDVKILGNDVIFLYGSSRFILDKRRFIFETNELMKKIEIFNNPHFQKNFT